MTIKNNFTQALRELTGYEDNEEMTKTFMESAGMDSNFEAIKREACQAFGEKVIDEDSMRVNRNENLDVSYDFDANSGESTTVITPNMVITGDITSKDVLEVEGVIRGSLKTTQDVKAIGLVIGNVAVDNLALMRSSIKGNITANGLVDVHEGSVVVGDIKAKNIKLDGKVKGDLDIEEAALLEEQALVSGSISTASISTRLGSRIQGSVSTESMNNDFDEDAEFAIGE